MAITNIASLHQYGETTAAIAMNVATVPKPFLGTDVDVLWGGSNYQLLTGGIQVPPVTVDPDQRPWLVIRPGASHSTTSTTCTMSVTNQTINPELRVPGTTVIFGFKFGSAAVINTGLYMGHRAPSTTAVTAAVSLTAIAGVVTGVNQYHWIDIIVKYLENDVVSVRMYSDKELVHSFETTYALHWAVGVGTMTRSLVSAVNYSQGFYLNDFITVVDKDTDEVKTGDIGPISILPLEHKDPVHNERWTPSPGMTLKESLSNRLAGNITTFPDTDLIRSDPYGGELKTSFKAPADEQRQILAMQQYFVAQKPASMGANLSYHQTYNGVLLGEKKVYNTGYNLEAFVAHMDTVMLPADLVAAKKEIESYGMNFSSSKKVIEI